MSDSLLSATSSPRPGFFGKVPSHGDFVFGGLPRSFLEPWDEWLKLGIGESRKLLGGEWLDVFLTSPLWRFAISAGVLDERAWVGMLFPSQDAAWPPRRFPFTVCAPFDPAGAITEALHPAWQLWYESIEPLALSCLEDDLDLDRFDREIQAHLPPTVGRPASGRRANPVGRSRAWRLEIPAVDEASSALPDMVDVLLEEVMGEFSLWWTSGSDRVAPSLLVYRRLPSPAGFASLLDGRWRGRGVVEIAGWNRCRGRQITPRS